MLFRILILSFVVANSVSCDAQEVGTDDVVLKAVMNAATHKEPIRRVTTKPQKMDPVFSALCSISSGDDEPKVHGAYYHIYVNDEAHEPLHKASTSYPVGSLIIKQKFTDQTATKTELFTVMRKMQGGYDSEHGDWEYSVVDRDMKLAIVRGKLESCIDCHAGYSDTGYVTRVYMDKADDTVVHDERHQMYEALR